MGTEARPLHPSLDFCDLCGTAVWRIIIIHVPREFVSAKIRAKIDEARANVGLSRTPLDLIMSVPLCRPCAELLGVHDSTPALDVGHVMSLAAQGPQPKDRVQAAAQEAILKLLAQYEAQWA